MSAAARDAGVTLHAGSIVETSVGRQYAARRARISGTRRWSSPRTAPSQATYRKIHRFGFGAGEPKLMEAGERIVTTELPDGSGGTVTAGPVHLLRPALPRALPRPARRGARRCSSSRPPGRAGGSRHWTLLAHARAIENQCVVIACNTAGTHSRTEMGGHSQVVLPTGEALAMAGLGEQVLSVDVDLSVVDSWRVRLPGPGRPATSRPCALTPGLRAPELRGRRWLNTGGHDLTLAELRGRVVLLDFWTFCCVNCLHVLDELRPVEERFPDELVRHRRPLAEVRARG